MKNMIKSMIKIEDSDDEGICGCVMFNGNQIAEVWDNEVYFSWAACSLDEFFENSEIEVADRSWIRGGKDIIEKIIEEEGYRVSNEY